MEQHEIPQTLDAPALALIFNASQLFCVVGFAIVGVVVGHPIIAAALGLMAGKYFHKYADTKPDGYLRHRAYFYGIPIMSGRHVPSGLDRELRP